VSAWWLLVAFIAGSFAPAFALSLVRWIGDPTKEQPMTWHALDLADDSDGD